MRSRLLFLSLLGPASAFYTLPYTLLARDPTVAQEAPATKTATKLKIAQAVASRNAAFATKDAAQADPLLARPDDGASARELANTGGRLKLLWHLQRPGPCGPGKHVALEPHEIPLPLLAMIAQDVVQPDGCNTCPEKGETAVWASPGDMCTLQNAGMLVNHGPLRHCASGSKYRDDYEPSHHVKACLPEADLDYLWNTEPPHCHDGRKPHAKPFIAKEGLLFCGQARGSSPPRPTAECLGKYTCSGGATCKQNPKGVEQNPYGDDINAITCEDPTNTQCTCAGAASSTGPGCIPCTCKNVENPGTTADPTPVWELKYTDCGTGNYGGFGNFPATGGQGDLVCNSSASPLTNSAGKRGSCSSWSTTECIPCTCKTVNCDGPGVAIPGQRSCEGMTLDELEYSDCGTGRYGTYGNFPATGGEGDVVCTSSQSPLPNSVGRRGSCTCNAESCEANEYIWNCGADWKKVAKTYQDQYTNCKLGTNFLNQFFVPTTIFRSRTKEDAWKSGPIPGTQTTPCRCTKDATYTDSPPTKPASCGTSNSTTPGRLSGTCCDAFWKHRAESYFTAWKESCKDAKLSQEFLTHETPYFSTEDTVLTILEDYCTCENDRKKFGWYYMADDCVEDMSAPYLKCLA